MFCRTLLVVALACAANAADYYNPAEGATAPSGVYLPADVESPQSCGWAFMNNVTVYWQTHIQQCTVEVDSFVYDAIVMGEKGVEKTINFVSKQTFVGKASPRNAMQPYTLNGLTAPMYCVVKIGEVNLSLYFDNEAQMIQWTDLKNPLCMSTTADAQDVYVNTDESIVTADYGVPGLVPWGPIKYDQLDNGDMYVEGFFIGQAVDLFLQESEYGVDENTVLYGKYNLFTTQERAPRGYAFVAPLNAKVLGRVKARDQVFVATDMLDFESAFVYGRPSLNVCATDGDCVLYQRVKGSARPAGGFKMNAVVDAYTGERYEFKPPKEIRKGEKYHQLKKRKKFNRKKRKQKRRELSAAQFLRT